MTARPTLSRSLSQALRVVANRPLPEKVARAAQLHFLDALGAGLGATASREGAAYAALATSLVQGGPSTIFGCTRGGAAADAALVNGGLVHALEVDDTHAGSIMHGSAVIAAAALASAEAYGASGAALLGAYARGWEVLVRLGLAAPGGFHARGFHATAVAGTFAAALVAAELMSLSEDQTVSALGIALSQASGVIEYASSGSSVKSLQPGWAAHSGVLAAVLACAGVTGPETALEGRRGLFRQFASDETAPEKFAAYIEDLGRTWHLPEVAFKFYPCCHYLHSFIEAAGILAERGVHASEISVLLCRVPAGEAFIICEPWEAKQSPATGPAGRWSLPIAVAARLIEGEVDFNTFEERASPEVLALAQRIRWEPLVNTRFPERFDAEIRCELRSGSVEEVRVDDVYGNCTRPPEPAAILDKFRANVARVLEPPEIQTLIEAVQGLESAPDLALLTGTIRTANPTPEVSET